MGVVVEFKHRCDRCKATETHDSRETLKGWRALYDLTTSQEVARLCPPCSEAFEDFLAGAPLFVSRVNG